MNSSQGMESADLDGMLERIEDLLDATKDLERFHLGLGIKLALGMARELQQKRPLGSDTSTWIQAWHNEYGEESAEKIVSVAREFLMNPDKLRQVFSDRLGMPRDTQH